MTTATAIKPLIVTVDTSGDYDFFLRRLETRLPRKARRGDVFFVLHADENKELYVPRHSYRDGEFDIYMNPTSYNDVVAQSTGEVHQSIAGLLRERCRKSGYYVIWESESTILLVPAPGKERSTKGFA